MPAFAGMTWWGRGLGAEAPQLIEVLCFFFFKKAALSSLLSSSA
jgi:hypothetical protein